MKRCLVYDPYINTLGGGERYVYALAAALASTMEVTLAGPDSPDPNRLDALEFLSRPVTTMSPARFSEASAAYDIAVYLTNSPPPPSYAEHSVLVVQFPFDGLDDESALRSEQQHALERYACVVYSDFVRNWLHRRWGCEATILPPPVEMGEYAPEVKGKLVLGVGRFFPDQHCKRQDTLVSAFAELLRHSELSEWRLVLAGGVTAEAAARDYVAAVRSAVGSLPIVIEENVSQDRLRSLYREATFFWHATGYGRDGHEPQRAEHFGMSTVEAMSYGAVPLVFADGGQVEVVTNDSGRLWTTQEQLVQQTTELVVDGPERQRLARNAELASRKFAPEAFGTSLLTLVDSLLARESEPGWSRRDASWSRFELGRLRRRIGKIDSELRRAQIQLHDYEEQLRDTQARAQRQLDTLEADVAEVRKVAQAQLDVYELQLAAARAKTEASPDAASEGNR